MLSYNRSKYKNDHSNSFLLMVTEDCFYNRLLLIEIGDFSYCDMNNLLLPYSNRSSDSITCAYYYPILIGATPYSYYYLVIGVLLLLSYCNRSNSIFLLLFSPRRSDLLLLFSNRRLFLLLLLRITVTG